MDELPVSLLILLIVAAVILGLWVGSRAGAYRSPEDRSTGKTLAARFRSFASDGVVRLWKWNRVRKRKAAASDDAQG